MCNPRKTVRIATALALVSVLTFLLAGVATVAVIKSIL